MRDLCIFGRTIWAHSRHTKEQDNRSLKEVDLKIVAMSSGGRRHCCSKLEDDGADAVEPMMACSTITAKIKD